MLAASQPQFVQYGSRIMPPPPYVHFGAKVHSFAVRGERDLIQKMCDMWFHGTSGGRVEYRLITPWLFVVCVNIDRVRSDHPDYRDCGYTPELDAGLWALVLRTWPFSLIPRWLPIHLFVDSPPAAFVGREVYGFPKQVGGFTVPANAPASDPFRIQGQVVRKRGDPVTWEDVFVIEPNGQSADAPVWTSLEELYDGLIGLASEKDDFLAGTDLFADLQALRGAFRLGGIPMAFLKQILDSMTATGASYQAIVEGGAGVLRFRHGGLTPTHFRLDVRSYYTLPFENMLGITPGFNDVGRAMWSDFDFVMEEGNVLWRNAI